jgi:hypothetical protein
MWTHIKDNAEAIAIVVAGLVGIGEARYRIKQNSKDIQEMKDEEYLTAEDCLKAQGVCQKIQCLANSDIADFELFL